MGLDEHMDLPQFDAMRLPRDMIDGHKPIKKPSNAEQAQIRAACQDAIDEHKKWLQIKVAGGTVYEIVIRLDKAMHPGRMLVTHRKTGVRCFFNYSDGDETV